MSGTASGDSNQNKLFSLFETHTQLYKRGKAGQPVQFGRLALVFEDGAGFISHYCLLDHTASDADVIVRETRRAQKVHRGAIQKASFDRGFYTLENKTALKKIVPQVNLGPRHPKQYAEYLEHETKADCALRRHYLDDEVESYSARIICGWLVPAMFPGPHCVRCSLIALKASSDYSDCTAA